MKLISYSKEFSYLWVWKLLLSWSQWDFIMGFYPDRENCLFELRIKKYEK